MWYQREVVEPNVTGSIERKSPSCAIIVEIDRLWAGIYYCNFLSIEMTEDVPCKRRKLDAMLLNFISLRSLYRIGCLMVISAGLAAADTLPDGPGLLLEDRAGRIYVAVLGSEGVVARNASDDADTWEVVAEGARPRSASCP